MAALSASLSGASDAAPRFSTSRARDDAFGIGTDPRSSAHRRQSCAGVQPSPRAAASLVRVGARNSAGSPCARGQCAMTLSTPAARAVSSSSLCGSRGCNSVCKQVQSRCNQGAIKVQSRSITCGSRGCNSVCRTCGTTIHVLSVNQGQSRSIKVNHLRHHRTRAECQSRSIKVNQGQSPAAPPYTC